MVEIREILCPTDFSEASRHALDHAMVIAKWYGSRITARRRSGRGHGDRHIDISGVRRGCLCLD